MKNLMKKASIILVIVMLSMVCLSFINSTYAYDMKTYITQIDTKTDGSQAGTSAKNIVGAILNIARIVAVGVAMIMLVVLAMKYMMAAPGDKAEIKKHAVVYVVGAVVLFASAGILTIIQNFATSNIKTS